MSTERVAGPLWVSAPPHPDTRTEGAAGREKGNTSENQQSSVHLEEQELC